jgi:hypothetical protein
MAMRPFSLAKEPILKEMLDQGWLVSQILEIILIVAYCFFLSTFS